MLNLSLENTTQSSVVLNQLPLCLESICIDELAKRSGFVKYPPKKITPKCFLLSFFQSILSNKKALRDLAINVGLFANCTVSKQAIDYRMNEALGEFLELVLSALLTQRSQLKTEWALTSDLFLPFSRVLLQDSTTIPLDARFASAFPGPSNRFGQHATAKIQAVLDLLAERFCYFDLSAFTKNDQKAAYDIFEIAQVGDLVIRDLGYFVLAAFWQFIEKNIHFLSRLKCGVVIFEQDGQIRLDLLKTLQEQGFLDMHVLLGAKEKVPARLVARPVPEEVHAKRVQEARQDRDQRLNHNENYMALLAWDVFITNVSEQIWTTEQACQVNQFRWRIEVVFKSWKSHFKINDLPKGDENRIKAHIYAALIFITLFQTNFYLRVANWAYRVQKADISMIKLAQFVKDLAWLFFILPYNELLKQAIMQQIAYHCRYEKRKRKSYPQKIRAVP